MTQDHPLLKSSLSTLLLIILPLTHAFAETESWIFNQHGDIQACSLLTEDQDGATVLIRHLVLPPASDRAAISDGQACKNASQALVKAQTERPNRTHFLSEAYYLDSNNLILNAQLSQGHTHALSFNGLPVTSSAAHYCERLHRQLTPENEAENCQAFVSNRWNIVGLEAPQEATGLPITLEQPTTPLLMLSGDQASGFQQVYDPLYSITEPLAFNYWRYWQYKDSPAYQAGVAALGGVEMAGGLVALGAGIATFNPALIALGGGLSITSLTTLYYAYSDWIQDPQSRAQNKEDALSYQQGSLQQKLASARDNQVHYQKELEDMGLFGSEAFIREKEVQYQTAELIHHQQLSFLQEELDQLKSGRARLQAELERSTQQESAPPVCEIQAPETTITHQVPTPEEYALPKYSEQDPYPEFTQRLNEDAVDPAPETYVAGSKVSELPTYENLPPAYSEHDPFPQSSIASVSINPPPAYETAAETTVTSRPANEAMTFVANLLAGQIADRDTGIAIKEAQINAARLTFELAHGREGRALKGYSAAKSSIRDSEEGLINNQQEQLRVSEEFKAMQLLNSYQQAEVAAR
ncbi:hypothetical protein [Endozoicomonas arenosclerae]|uniref:hypothetical protein n=1 Tax=Endozoicomonas arenosclerae TaxID=1633495 RepID=UPI000781FC18|nr:hypothetical protein [Endozoicomonas arenosclerae]